MKPTAIKTLTLFLLVVISLTPIQATSAKVASSSPYLAWEKIGTSPMPAPRDGFAMVYNPINQVALFFGGLSMKAGHVLFNDLWMTNGSQWMQFTTPHQPPGRMYPSLAYDTDRKEAVLFGGEKGNYVSGDYFNDTWTFDGVDWQEQHPGLSPSPRSGASLVYDPAHHLTYLFGGYYYEGDLRHVFNDTWAWDGSNWQMLSPGTAPSVRDSAPMVYDPIHQNILLYGGRGYARYLTDTWIWNGSEWAEQEPMHQPLMTQYYGQMTFDASRQKLILVGVTTYRGPIDNLVWTTETWAWDGQDWMQLPVVKPLPEELLYNGQLVYFPALQTVGLVDTFEQKVGNPDGTIGLVARSAVWALYERYASFIPFISR